MKNTTHTGSLAESLAVNFLLGRGHKIVQRNARNRFYELDILSISGDYIILTEVKYRKNSRYGGGLSAISRDKITRLQKGFTMWLSDNSSYNNYQPRIDVISIDESGELEHIENAIF